MKKRFKRVFKVSVCFFSILFVLVLGFAVSADETVTDLSGTTWSWNFSEHPVFLGTSQSTTSKSISFTSNDEEFTALAFYVNSNTTSLSYTPNTPNGSVWFWDGVNFNTKSDYQVIHITGGTAVTDSQLIGWITANATQIIPEPNIWDNIGAFLSSCVAWLGSVVTYITGNEVLTIFVLGIAVISFSIGVLRRLLNTRG